MSTVTSIIVPTHNRPASLAETLQHLRATESSLKTREVIVVDDGSNPPVTLESAHCRVIRTPGIERSRARNLGASVARGALLIFVDDDMTVPERFVTFHEQAAEDFPGALCVGGVSLDAQVTLSPFGRFRRLIEDPSQARPRGFVQEKNFCTATNMSIHRDTFLSLGGFDPAIISGEDQDFALRFSARGGRIAFLPEATALHRDSAMDIGSYCRRHEWGARAMAPFVRRHSAFSDNIGRLRFDPTPPDGHPTVGRTAVSLRRALAQPRSLRILLGVTSWLEHIGTGDAVLFLLYRVVLGLHIFRGLRAGLSTVRVPPPLPAPIVPGFEDVL